MRRLLFAAVALFPLHAHAAQWDVIPASSKLFFEGTQSGDPFRGNFTRFTPVIDFDAAHPEKGSITVTVDMTSVTSADPDQQDALVGPEFLDVKAHAQAVYQSSAIVSDQAGNFIVDGTLTLKGISHPMRLFFSLSEEAGITTAMGEGELQRNVFKVGTGDYASDEWIAYPVKVKFSVDAKPKA